MKPIAPRPIIDLSGPEQQTTQVLDLSRSLHRHTVRLEISENLLTELREAHAPEATPQFVAPPAAEPASLQSGNTLILHPAPMRTLTFARPQHLLQRPPSVELVNTLYDGGALRERAAQLASVHEVETAAACAQSAPEHRRPVARAVLRRLLATFRRSSLPKQLTIALLPLAIAGVWTMRDGSRSASGARTVAPVRAPANAAPPALVVPAPALSVSPAPPASSLPEATLESAAQPNDPSERLALIAAFSGNQAEAAALYESLALKRHSRTFALAARLIREDRVRKP